MKKTSNLVLILFLSTLLFINVKNEDSLNILGSITLQQKQNFKEAINGRTLKGKWGCVEELFYEPGQCQLFQVPKNSNKLIVEKDQQQIEPMNFFTSKNEGKLEGFFYTSGEGKFKNKLYLLLFRQGHRTGQVIELDIDLSKAEKFSFKTQKNKTKMVAYQQQNLITTANLYENQELFVKYDLSISIQIFILEDGLTLLNPYNQGKQIRTPIRIRIFSDSMSFAAELKSPQESQTIMLLTFLALAQFVFIFLNPSTSQQNVSKTRSIMFRISQWFILQMYAFIIVFSKEYINLGLKYFDTDLGYLIYLGLGNIGIGLLFLRKYEMVLQKFTNKRMLIFGILFFCAYWYLASKYFHDPFFWILQLTAIFQLQILYSMLNGGKGGVPYDLMGFMILSRVPFIYMQLSEENIWNREVMNGQYLKLLIGVFLFHLTVILLQSFKGGQFMIPNKIIPGYFNYYISRAQNHPQLKQQCPICTSLLGKSPDSIEVTQSIEQSSVNSIQSGEQVEIQSTNTYISADTVPKVKGEKQTQYNDSHKKGYESHSKTVKVMRTPCNHIFHIDCLTKWMQNKLVCPYCRSTLPQLASLEKQ